LTPDTIRTEALLVPPARARLLAIYNPQAWYGAGQYFAPNPEFGAAIDYYLRDGSKDDVQVTIADARGNPVRHLKGGRRQGLNHVEWDLRMEPPVAETSRDLAASSVLAGAILGPLVLPGIYTVTLNAVNRQLKAELRVEGDPRTAFPEGDRRTRQTALVNLYELQKSLDAARSAMTAALNHRDVSSGLLPLQGEIASELNTAGTLSRAIEGYSGLPTADQRRQLDWLFEDASKTIASMNRLLQSDVRTPSRPVSPPAKRE
jgi:hypothetical protein